MNTTNVIKDLDKARKHYRLACAFNPNDLFARVKFKDIEKIYNSRTDKRELAKILTTDEFINLHKQENKKYLLSDELSYEYKIVINGTTQNRNIKISFDPSTLIKCENIRNLGGGLLVAEHDKKNIIISDTKHLDDKHLKLFSPLLVMYDAHNALIINNNNDDDKVIFQEAFVVPGLGWNYYHWLLEVVPVLAIYEESGLRDKVPIAFQFSLKKWHMETLDLMGFSDIEILPYMPDQFVQYETTYVPIPASRDLVASTSSIQYLRNKLISQQSEVIHGRKLYLTRKNVDAVRKSKGTKEIERILTKKGFEFVDPSRMSIAKQIKLFSDVEVIVAEGGAALTNLLFCREKTRVIVITGDRAWSETFTPIAASAKLDLTVLFSKCHPHPNPYFLWTAFDYELSGDILEQELSNISDVTQ